MVSATSHPVEPPGTRARACGHSTACSSPAPRLAAAALACIFLLFAFALPVGADSIRQQDIVNGRIVPRSLSPDSKFLFLEVFHGDSTFTSVILAKTDRSEQVGSAPIATLYSTDRPYRGRTTILWNTDSQRVAIQDNLNRHSKLALRRLAGGEFEAVPLPDLLLAACKEWGVRPERVTSSGERPVRWGEDDELTVEVTANLNGGGKRTATLRLRAPQNGTVMLGPDKPPAPRASKKSPVARVLK